MFLDYTYKLPVCDMQVKRGDSLTIPNTFLVHSKQKAIELLDEWVKCMISSAKIHHHVFKALWNVSQSQSSVSGQLSYTSNSASICIYHSHDFFRWPSCNSFFCHHCTQGNSDANCKHLYILWNVNGMYKSVIRIDFSKQRCSVLEYLCAYKHMWFFLKEHTLVIINVNIVLLRPTVVFI